MDPHYRYEKKKVAQELEIRNGLRFADVDGKALLEVKAAREGLAWEDFCRERDRIKLPSGGFTREVWEGCDLMARKSMMAQYAAMQDSHFEPPEPPKDWGRW